MSEHNAQEPELITVDEAALRYGMTREGLYYHKRKGSLNIYKRRGDKHSYMSVAELDKLFSFQKDTAPKLTATLAVI